MLKKICLRKVAALLLAGMLSGMVVVALAQTKPDAASAPAHAETAGEVVERAIRLSATEFMQAYNAHDSAAVARQFVPQGEFVDPDGRVVVGQTDIERQFARHFAEYPHARLEITISSVRQPAPGIAIEESTNSVAGLSAGPPLVTRCNVVHVKSGDRWRIASSRDFSDQPAVDSDANHLQELKFLVGDWVDEGHDALVETSTRWSDDGKFLLQTFSVRVAGEIALTGSSRIGWDPRARQIRSWVFDSRGGFGEGRWVKEGQSWTIRTTGISSNGQMDAATNVLTVIDRDTLVCRSRDRMVGGESAQGDGEVIIKRRPPAKPQIAEKVHAAPPAGN